MSVALETQIAVHNEYFILYIRHTVNDSDDSFFSYKIDNWYLSGSLLTTNITSTLRINDHQSQPGAVEPPEDHFNNL